MMEAVERGRYGLKFQEYQGEEPVEEFPCEVIVNHASGETCGDPATRTATRDLPEYLGFIFDCGNHADYRVDDTLPAIGESA